MKNNCPELYCFASSLEEAKPLLDAGVRLLQYRNKTAYYDQALNEASKLVSFASQYSNARVIVNDSIHIALESGAYGVHLGQDDGDYHHIIQNYKDRLCIGVSVDTVSEALDVCKSGADYIGAGAVFGSSTKKDAPYMGIPLLHKICQASSIPVSAIGGITLKSMSLVLQCGPNYICVISDINSAKNPFSQAKKYINLLKEFSYEKSQ